MSALLDLVDSATLATELAGGLPANTAALAACGSAASRSIRRWCARDFTLTSYDELYSWRGWTELLLRQYPVASVSRVAIGLTPVLTITNGSPSTNQRATAALNTTGDGDIGLTVLGLTLTRVASGTTVIDTTTLFATYVTIGQVAAYINTLGNGWVATVAVGYTNWSSADILAPQGARSAFGPGAAFQVHATDASDWDINYTNGIMRLGDTPGGSGAPSLASGGFGFGIAINDSAGTVFNGVRVAYTAGFATIPADIVKAVEITARSYLSALQTDPKFESETADKWSYKLANMKGIPVAAMEILLQGGWKSYRTRTS